MNNDNNSLERRIVFFSIQNGQAPFPLGWGWLYLINYEDSEHAVLRGRTTRQFAVIQVHALNPTQEGGILKEDKWILDEAQFFQWFKRLNSRGQVRF